MAKKANWRCRECQASTGQWYGRCPTCGAWNSIEEVEDLATMVESTDRVRLSVQSGPSEVVSSTQAAATAAEEKRSRTGISELDRVLGGGLVPGSLVLVGGAPGIGKSTLLLQACAGVVDGGKTVLYASGEESISQVGNRAERLGVQRDALYLMADTRIESILEAAGNQKPDLLVVDSIQTVYSDANDGLPGNVSQIRQVTAKLLTWSKTSNVPVVVVGHVTKEGQLAGPRLLEHMVDAVLSFEGDEERATRLLRATKNRFGSTQELGVFEMAGDGLREVSNPSEAFLGDQSSGAPGSCVTASIEGSRPLLLEVQALLSPSPGGNPRRTSLGVEPSRVAMQLAVLGRHARLKVVDQDVFVNVAGGFRLREPSADLAVMLAIASSLFNRPLPPHTLALGEIGLTGEVRRVPQLEKRLAEAAKLGFTSAIIPASKSKRKLARPKGLRLIEVQRIEQAIQSVFSRD